MGCKPIPANSNNFLLGLADYFLDLSEQILVIVEGNLHLL